jgi:hypothetical protein
VVDALEQNPLADHGRHRRRRLRERDLKGAHMSNDPKHDSANSSTQKSVPPKGSPGKPYQCGSNVHRGGGPKPSKPVPLAEKDGTR